MTRRLTLWVSTLAEIVLLSVADTEDVVSYELNAKNGDSTDKTELDGGKGEVSSLESVGKGDPGQVSDREHESESVGRNVHLGEDGGL